MNDEWAKPHHQSAKINSLSDVGPNFLGELTDYFTQNPLPVPLQRVQSYGLQTQTTRVSRGSVTIADSTFTILDYDTETWDFADLHSTSTNPSRITIKADGKYLVGTWLEFDTNAAGYRLAQILKNGTATVTETRAPVTGNITSVAVVDAIDLVANDYVQTKVLQTSGGNLSCLAASFWAARQTT